MSHTCVVGDMTMNLLVSFCTRRFLPRVCCLSGMPVAQSYVSGALLHTCVVGDMSSNSVMDNSVWFVNC